MPHLPSSRPVPPSHIGHQFLSVSGCIKLDQTALCGLHLLPANSREQPKAFRVNRCLFGGHHLAVQVIEAVHMLNELQWQGNVITIFYRKSSNTSKMHCSKLDILLWTSCMIFLCSLLIPLRRLVSHSLSSSSGDIMESSAAILNLFTARVQSTYPVCTIKKFLFTKTEFMKMAGSALKRLMAEYKRELFGCI